MYLFFFPCLLSNLLLSLGWLVGCMTASHNASHAQLDLEREKRLCRQTDRQTDRQADRVLYALSNFYALLFFRTSDCPRWHLQLVVVPSMGMGGPTAVSITMIGSTFSAHVGPPFFNPPDP